MKNSVLFLVGPTGSGKTELSILLAKRLGSEIVSADSMQVYRGMNIGTAKPSAALRRKVRHHLIDVVSPQENFSVYRYRTSALRAIRDVLKRDRIPLVVGGSGLYLEALWKGLSAPLGENSKLRKKLNADAERKEPRFLHSQLAKIDPVRANQIHPNDRRRIIRALEIAKLSQKKPSEWQKERKSLAHLGFYVLVVGITRDRHELYERINNRVETMFRKGLMKEVEQIKKRGFSKTAKQALGYREVLQGGAEKSIIISLVQKKTRQFAKRQLTWFRKEKEIEWIPWTIGEDVSGVCGKIMNVVKPWLEKKHSS